MTHQRNRRRSAAALPMTLARAAVSRPLCEPVEIEDPTNAALDQIEAHVRDVLRAGGEHALRRRLERLLPSAEVVDGRGPVNARPGAEAGGGCLPPSPASLVETAAEGDGHG